MIVQFVNQQAQPPVIITKTMAAPKTAGASLAWLKQARKVIPQIPPTKPGADWEVFSTESSVNFIKFTLTQCNDSCIKVHVVIDRRHKGGF